MKALENLSSFSGKYCIWSYDEGTDELFAYIEPISENYEALLQLSKEVIINHTLLRNAYHLNLADLKINIADYLLFEFKNWLTRINQIPEIAPKFVRAIYEINIPEDEATIPKILEFKDIFSAPELSTTLEKMHHLVINEKFQSIDTTLSQARDKIASHGVLKHNQIENLSDEILINSGESTPESFIDLVETEQSTIKNISETTNTIGSQLFYLTYLTFHYCYDDFLVRLKSKDEY